MRTKNDLLKYEFTINSFEREAGSFIAKKNDCVVDIMFGLNQGGLYVQAVC